jgi:hypothetical protein
MKSIAMLSKSLALLTLLAGCGGSQPPIAAPGAMAQSSTIAAHAEREGSWMLSKAVSQDLLYTGNVGYVTVYSYPQGRLEGLLYGFSDVNGMCADASGDIFVGDIGRVVEYAHGHPLPKKILRSYGALGCSVDPTSGDLAVTSAGGVEIYKDGHGPLKLYRDASFKAFSFCGYDNKGNLFVDGITSDYSFIFAELPKGGGSLRTITLDQSIGWPEQVQWDGKHIAVGDQLTPAIYRFAIKGSRGVKVGTTSLNHATYLGQSWIEGQTLTVPLTYNTGRFRHAEIVLYRYPLGGKPIEVIPHSLTDGPNSAAVSLAPNR